MKDRRSKKLTYILTAAGIFLILGAVLLMIVSNIIGSRATARNQEIVSEVYSLLPEIRNAFPDDRLNMNMPLLEIDGQDFVGIIEMPAYETRLPIYGNWEKNKVTSFPCRYTGSMYDGSLIIGGSDNAGQFDFMKMITNGDYVFVTDMTGIRYAYQVSTIEKTSDVSTENLTSEVADLILFARNSYSMDYTVVRCTLNGSR